MKLSKRMKAVADMVTTEGILADVGTDHGYVPIALMQKQKIKGAIAMDINEGPLMRAKQNIAAAHLEDAIQTRLSDGVASLEPKEADTVLMAGMGGELIIHILSEGEKVCRAVSELVLQPQSDIARVREYLRKNRYKIVDEDMIFEEGKYYPMMRVIPVCQDETWERMNAQTIETCDAYGPLLLRNGHPVLRRFLVRQHRQLTQLLQRLMAQNQSEAVVKRIGEVRRKLQVNESAYTILGAIKNAGI